VYTRLWLSASITIGGIEWLSSDAAEISLGFRGLGQT